MEAPRARYRQHDAPAPPPTPAPTLAPNLLFPPPRHPPSPSPSARVIWQILVIDLLSQEKLPAPVVPRIAVRVPPPPTEGSNKAGSMSSTHTLTGSQKTKHGGSESTRRGEGEGGGDGKGGGGRGGGGGARKRSTSISGGGRGGGGGGGGGRRRRRKKNDCADRFFEVSATFQVCLGMTCRILMTSWPFFHDVAHFETACQD